MKNSTTALYRAPLNNRTAIVILISFLFSYQATASDRYIYPVGVQPGLVYTSFGVIKQITCDTIVRFFLAQKGTVKWPPPQVGRSGCTYGVDSCSVIKTIKYPAGPISYTVAAQVYRRACPPGSHYVSETRKRLGYFNAVPIGGTTDLTSGNPECPADHPNVSPMTQNPVNLISGNKYFAEQDFVGRGAFPLRFTRFYNSRINAQYPFYTDEPGISAWSHSYQRSLALRLINKGDNGRVIAYRDDGQIWEFKPKRNGSGWQGPAGHLSALTQTAQGWRLETPLNRIEEYDKNGLLQSILDLGSGLRQTLQYNIAARTVTVTHSSGDTLILHYQHYVNKHIGFQTLAKLTTPDGTYHYRYKTVEDSTGEVYHSNQLLSVRLPDNTPQQRHR